MMWIQHEYAPYTMLHPFPRAADGIELKWVDGKAPSSSMNGSTFGVPWAQGEINRTTSLAISSDGNSVPIQSWPLAYWPDGSLKWTGHSLAANSGLSPTLRIAPGIPAEPDLPVSVLDWNGAITVTAGGFKAVFNKAGSQEIIESLSLDGQIKAQNGTLLVHVQDLPDEPENGGPKPNIDITKGKVGTVTIEQKGPVRAVIKVTGVYSGNGHKSWLPWTVRFYISAGATSMRMVHFFAFDGDQHKDFIRAIGLTLEVPLSDELYDRHVRFVTTEGGIWGEPVRVLSGLRRDATAAVLEPQFQGQAVPPLPTWPSNVSSKVNELPVWAEFTLDQLSPDRFTVAKRTNAGNKASFLPHAGHGKRASGLGYIGGAKSGGLVFGVQEFWEGTPRGIDIRKASSELATVTLWAYSPRGPAMDLRHYDTVAHGLDLTYEDVGNPDPSPAGIGRSYEVDLQIVSSTPSRDALAALGQTHAARPQIIATPEFYAAHKLFGRWNVPETSTNGARSLEKRKSELLDFYMQEIEQREWLGFFNFGDFQHTYDSTRHEWRYDVGGYAWVNGELGTDLWLWISFLRTGRADVWRAAHAMTKHLAEVDSHHIGPFAGLGSRHNVSHWGDGAKEARIAGSTLRRPYYYLTADEFMGDYITSTLQADTSVVTWEPLRKVTTAPPYAPHPGRLRLGPDWFALAGNWFVAWERTNDPKYKEKIVTGMASQLKDIASFKYGLFTGFASAVGYDPKTAHLFDIGGEGLDSYHLTSLFGGGEFMMELVETIKDVPEFDAAWLDFCRLFNGTDAQKIERYGKSFRSGGFSQLYAKLQAYAGERLNNPELKQAAWDIVNANKTGVFPAVSRVGGANVPNEINEITGVNTNDAASLSLAEYAVLAIAPELAPNSMLEEVNELDDETVADEEMSEKRATGNSDVHVPPRKGLFRRLLCA